MAESSEKPATPKPSENTSVLAYVASKLPSPLQLSTPAGTVTIQAAPRARMPNDNTYPGGYAITRVPKVIWEAWLRSNFNSDMVLNHLVHGETNYDECVAFCYRHSRIQSGLTPVRVGNPIAGAGKPK